MLTHTQPVTVEVIAGRIFRTRIEPLGSGYVAIVDELADWPASDAVLRESGVRIWSGLATGAIRPTPGLAGESGRRAISMHLADGAQRHGVRRVAI